MKSLGSECFGVGRWRGGGALSFKKSVKKLKGKSKALRGDCFGRAMLTMKHAKYTAKKEFESLRVLLD